MHSLTCTFPLCQERPTRSVSTEQGLFAELSSHYLLELTPLTRQDVSCLQAPRVSHRHLRQSGLNLQPNDQQRRVVDCQWSQKQLLETWLSPFPPLDPALPLKWCIILTRSKEYFSPANLDCPKFHSDVNCFSGGIRRSEIWFICIGTIVNPKC